MPRRRNLDDDEVKHLPVLKGVYEKLEMEARSRGMTPSELIEELFSEPGAENFSFYFTKKLVDNLNSEFYSRKLTRAEFLSEFLVYAGLASRMAQAGMMPVVEILDRVGEKIADAFKTGLAVAPEGRGEDKTQQLKLQMLQTISNLAGRMIDIWSAQFTGQLHGIQTKSIKEFEQEEMQKLGLAKPPAPQVKTESLAEFEKKGD